MIATYSCATCGMAVNATCANCNVPLVNDSLALADGSNVQISRCPQCEGKIKSPMCCGSDMSCSYSFIPIKLKHARAGEKNL